VHYAGRNREAPNFPRRDFDLAYLVRFLETHLARADDRGHFDRSAMKVIAANAAGFGQNDMDVLLARQFLIIQGLEQTAARVTMRLQHFNDRASGSR
jgi:hypothetical protein